MLNRVFKFLIAIFVFPPLFVFSAPSSYAPAVKKAAPSVVSLYVMRHSPRGAHSRYDLGARRARPNLRQQHVLGSGVIMNANGYILTNSHVVDDHQHIYALLNDGRATKARIVGIDPETDLAVLQIALKDFSPMTLGDSNSLEPGDVVLAIGNPHGLGPTVTQGVVSAVNRKGVGLHAIENLIQTDVALNPGNSGGALINAKGDLVGINSAIYTRSGGYQGISFTIPINAANKVLMQLIKYGKVMRGSLGLDVLTLDPMHIYDLKTKLTHGVIIEKVEKGSPALGVLRKNDIIIKANKQPIRTAKDFKTIVLQCAPGDFLTLRYERQNRQKTAKIKCQFRTLSVLSPSIRHLIFLRSIHAKRGLI